LTSLYKNFGIILLVFIFVQKYQVGPLAFFCLNLVRLLKKWRNFVLYSSNFLNRTKDFSSKLKLLIKMVCFVGVIDIILVSTLIKNHYCASRNLTKKIKLH